MDPPISHVVFEAAGLWINAPDTQLGTIERQLQPIVAVLERRLVAPPLSKQRGENERARRYGQQRYLCGMHAISEAYARIT